MSQQKKNFALPIAMMFILFAMIAFVTNLCSPMGVIVKNQFGASNFAASLGTAANFIAYAIMGIPSGLLLKKIGYKNTALLAIAVGFTGVLVQYLTGKASQDFAFPIYLTGAFIAGFSMCMLNTVVNPMLNTLGGGGNKGNQLIQFGGTLNSFSATFVTILVGALIGDATKATIDNATPALFSAMAIFAVVFVVLFLVKIPEPAKAQESKKAEKDPHSAFSFRHFNFGILAIFVYMGIEAGVPYYVNQYLTTSVDKSGFGLDAGAAGTIVGIFWLLMLVGRLCGGVLGEKFSSRTQIGAVSALCLLFLLLGMFMPDNVLISMPGFNGSEGSFAMVEVPIGILFFILTGLCTSVMWGGIFNMAVEGLGKYTAFASGMFMVMVCGGGIIPPIQGWVADLTGSILDSYFVVVACAAYILWYALVGSKIVNKDIVTD